MWKEIKMAKFLHIHKRISQIEFDIIFSLLHISLYLEEEMLNIW